MKDRAFSCVLRTFTAVLTLVLLAAPAQQTEAQTPADSLPGTWKTLTASSGQPVKRHESAYARVGNKLYAVGGRGERPVQIYNPETDTWTTGATPPVNMHHLQAVSYDGKIYVLSALTGDFPDEDPLSNVYIYDPETDTWEKGPTIPEDRRRGAAGAVAHDSMLYVVGGIQNGHIDGQVRWLDAFNPETGEWKQLPDAPRRRDHFQAGVIGDKLYAVGGRRTSQATENTFELTIPEVDRYDFSTGTWEALPPSSDLPTERAGSTTVTAEGRLIVLGGESGSQEAAHAEVEMFNPETGEWSTLAPMNQGRHGTQAVVHDGKVYIVAGSKTRGATEINSHEVFTLPETISEQAGGAP